MQNQSISEVGNSSLRKFLDNPDIPDHVSPFGRLWTNIPDHQTNWLHQHGFLEIGRCVKGSGIFHINDKIARIKEPCASIIYPGMWHSAQSTPSDESVWNFLYVDLNFFLSRIHESALSSIKGLQWENYDFPVIMNRSEYPSIAFLTDMIFDEASNKREDAIEMLTGLIEVLLIEHSRLMKNRDGKIPNLNAFKRISPAISYMDAHYSENIRVDDLAQLCFVSTATLRRYFQDLLNMSPISYLHKLRVKQAANMLITSNKSVMDISLETGYPTLSSFNRQFGAYYGISPREYRKKCKERI